jgi:hypothetical protein
VCNVKPPTSFHWGSGKTKNIKGEPLLLAAAAFGVTPGWLATGKGPKFPALEPPASPIAGEKPASYQWNPPPPPWPFESISEEDYKKLSDLDRREVEGFVKGLLQANRRRLKSGEATG